MKRCGRDSEDQKAPIYVRYSVEYRDDAFFDGYRTWKCQKPNIPCAMQYRVAFTTKDSVWKDVSGVKKGLHPVDTSGSNTLAEYFHIFVIIYINQIFYGEL